jgi:peptide/nickel transport system substrate-binding protein
MKIRWFWSATVTLALTCGVLVASGAAPASGSSTKPVLTIALPSPPTSLDPSKGSGATNVQFQDPAYQGLLHAGGNGGQITPSLASSYQWLGTGNQRLKIVLRPGLQFSDGAPLNSDAVKLSAEHFAAAGGQFAYVGQEVASIETPDPRTVIFDLKASDPTFPSGLAETSGLGMIVGTQGLTGTTNLGTTTDGAGPYELSQGQTVEGSTYTYVPNPHYYNPSGVKYSKIVIRVIASPNTALAALQSGQVQVAFGDPDTYREAKSSGVSAALFAGSTDGLWLDDTTGTLTPALGNEKVRQALNFAINRVAVAKAVTLGTGSPTVQMAIPGTFGYLASIERTYPYSVSKAKSLLAQAGYSHGFSLTATVPTFMPTASTLAQILSAQLAAIGVTLRIIGSTTFPSYASAQTSGNYDATVFSLPFTQGIPSAISIGFQPNAIGNPRHESYPTVLPAAQAASSLSGPKANPAWQGVNRTIVQEALEVPIETESTIDYYKGVRGVFSSGGNPVFMSPS